MRFLYLLCVIGVIFGLNEIALAKKLGKTQSAPTAIHGTQQLVNTLNNILSANRPNGDVAVYVKSMQHGDSLYALNVYQPLVPASTLKIFTAEAALLFLGPSYRFSTQVWTDAKGVKNGVLQGNLYIVLSGDPTLTYNDLADLMQSLKAEQIQAIAGNVYIDNTAYDKNFYGPGWDQKDKNYCYGAPISAGIVNHNCLSLSVAPAKTSGGTAQLITSPKYFYPTINNTVVTQAKRGRSCYVRVSKGFSNSINLDGCMPKGGYSWGFSYVVTDIPEYNRALFKNLLRQLSIKVAGNVTFGSAPTKNLALIGSHNSKPLRLLITEMLKKSDNIIASALFKKIGQLYTSKPGSWENGSLAVSQILAKNAGMNIKGARILDGSGLSSDNLASPAQMMQLLNFTYHHYQTSFEFISALPIAGVDGTLKGRMQNIPRKVRAKTGSLSGSGVVSLAGYAVSADKEPLAFVIMINGSKGMGWRYKELEDKIATALTQYKRGG
jgi:D-alanyl-D-alanine carboxypeptidase/D-alanyl-D-alanine-endopeptidase (penicillin-binding protein 4)